MSDGRLRSRIAPRAHDERDEQGEHNRLFQFALKILHGARGEHFAQEQCTKPPCPLLHHRQKADAQIGLAKRLHAAELLRIFGVFVENGIDHVVDGDDALQIALRIDDRHRQQIIFRDETGDVHPAGIGENTHGIAMREIENMRVRRQRDQFAQRHGPAQVARAGLDQVKGVDRLRRHIGMTDGVERRGRRHRAIERDKLRRHDRARRIGREAQQPVERRAVRRRQIAPQRFRFWRIELAKDIGATVRRHGRQQSRGGGLLEQAKETRFALEPRHVENAHRFGRRQSDNRRGCRFQRHDIETLDRVGGAQRAEAGHLAGWLTSSGFPMRALSRAGPSRLAACRATEGAMPGVAVGGKDGSADRTF